MPDPVKPGAVALITGAASGIGRAAALALAARGMRVALADLPGEKLDSAAAEAGGLKIEVDLSRPGAVEAMRAALLPALGAPALLMNNAASRAGRGFDAAPEDWRAAFEVNFWAVAEACRVFLPDMAAAGGAIVNTGSKQGITNPPGHPAYNAAKAALKSWTEGLEHELRARPGPRVSAHLLIPGWTTTGDAAHRPGAWLPEQVVDRMLAGLAAGDFYILCPDDETTEEMDRKRILWAAGDVAENRPPLSRWHPDWKERAAASCS
ncbi:MAG: SDR family NAD(P)-dependent oxidoreductase [Pikeienuella sp.]|uniref:SDR family NAD(P)-dependent oxidoreductase n=1 Tax=Pikeienuella sp. TaxID=2831957 RepID=UPI00391B6363